MKFENNNKAVIKRLTNGTIKANKTRNIFAVLAIILTTFMISAVFTIGISFYKNYKIMNYRMEGSLSTVSLNNPTDKQVQDINKLDICDSIGVEIRIGKANIDKSNTNNKIIINYEDSTRWEKQISPCMSNIKGSYPVKYSEIIISEKALELLKIEDAKIGDKVKLSYNNDKVEEFIISGIYKTYGIAETTGYINVSKKYIDKNNISLQDNGSVNLSISKNNKDNVQELLESKIKLNQGQVFSYSFDIRDEISSSAIGTVILVLIVSLFILLSGYLLVYNIMYISVVKDINFYGLLKTIGTSPKQIKKIVKGQALRFSLIGIPIGILLGALTSLKIVPIIMKQMFSDGLTYGSSMPTDMVFNPVIYILAAIFSLTTVLISCNRSAKIASKISPTEALKYTGIQTKSKKKNRKSTKGGKLYKMAFHNVFRDKKRATIVFVSLFFGVITFLSVITFVQSINVKNYIKYYVPSDFEISYYTENNLTDSVVNEILNIDGINESSIAKSSSISIKNTKLLENIIRKECERFGVSEQYDSTIDMIQNEPEKIGESIVGIDSSIINRINDNKNYNIDIEKFENGEIILIDIPFSLSGNNSEINKLNNATLKIKFTNNNVEKEFKIVTIDRSKDNLNYIPYSSCDVIGMPNIYISNEILKDLDNNCENLSLSMDVDENKEPVIYKQLDKITKNSGLCLEAKSKIKSDFEKTTMAMYVLGGSIAAVLILIGLLNFINVMITGVNSRMKELAVLESIGMTKKQIKKMLTYEGIYYAAVTTMFLLTIGLLIIRGIGYLSTLIADYAQFVFPIGTMVLLIGTIFIVCIFTPSLVYKYSSRKTVTERLREIEN